jgi:hypothetical protein
LLLAALASARLTVWATALPPSASHPRHNHEGNLCSGVYYVTIPEGAQALVFDDPRGTPWRHLDEVSAEAIQGAREGRGGRGARGDTVEEVSKDAQSTPEDPRGTPWRQLDLVPAEAMQGAREGRGGNSTEAGAGDMPEEGGARGGRGGQGAKGGIGEEGVRGTPRGHLDSVSVDAMQHGAEAGKAQGGPGGKQTASPRYTREQLESIGHWLPGERPHAPFITQHAFLPREGDLIVFPPWLSHSVQATYQEATLCAAEEGGRCVYQAGEERAGCEGGPSSTAREKPRSVTREGPGSVAEEGQRCPDQNIKREARRRGRTPATQPEKPGSVGEEGPGLDPEEQRRCPDQNGKREARRRGQAPPTKPESTRMSYAFNLESLSAMAAWALTV